LAHSGADLMRRHVCSWRKLTQHPLPILQKLALVPPQRSVILDAELCEHARGEPARVMFASPSKLDDLLADKLGHSVFHANGEPELDAHSLEGPVHGLNVLGLESESTGSWPYHRGAANGLELGPPPPIFARYTSLPTNP
jgi:hypothetical protein